MDNIDKLSLSALLFNIERQKVWQIYYQGLKDEHSVSVCRALIDMLSTEAQKRGGPCKA